MHHERKRVLLEPNHDGARLVHPGAAGPLRNGAVLHRRPICKGVWQASGKQQKRRPKGTAGRFSCRNHTLPGVQDRRGAGNPAVQNPQHHSSPAGRPCAAGSQSLYSDLAAINWSLAGSPNGMLSNVFVGNGFIRSETSVSIFGSLEGNGPQFSTFFHSMCTP